MTLKPHFSKAFTSADSELVKSAVEILIYQRSKTRWSSLRFLLSSSRLTPNQVSEVALGIKSKPHIALRFFEFTLSHPSIFSHDLSSFSTLSHVFARARLKNSAQRAMRVALLSPDSLNHSQPAMKFFDLLTSSYHQCDSAPFVFDLLLTTCLDLKKTDEAIAIARKARSSLQQISFNALILSVTKRKGFTEGYSLFKELSEGNREARRVIPGTITFNALAEGCLKSGETEYLGEIRGEMERLGCLPDNETYGILMQAESEAGRIDAVERLWGEMKGKKMEPDVVCYNTVIGALCSAGRAAEAEEIQRDMEEKGVDSTCATYEHLVRGFCAAGDAGAAVVIYNDMRRKRLDPQCLTVCMVVEVLCEAKRIGEAVAVKEGAAGLCLREKSYEALVIGLCEDGYVDEALYVQAEMAGKGFSPTRNVYDAFILAYRKAGDNRMAGRLHVEMQKYFV